MKTSDDKEPLLKAFETTLNEHGYGFQYAVLNKLKDLYTSGRSAVSVEVAEFPVATHADDSKNTKIDFIGQRIAPLPYGSGERVGPKIFLLAECKRANPAYSNWCFIRAPFTRRTGLVNSLILEAGFVNSLSIPFMQVMQYPTNMTTFFHVAVPIKSDRRGNSSGDQGRDVIELTATQSLRGLNGFANFIKRRPEVIGKGEEFILFPVIFTTAGLWTCDADLGRADVESGNIDVSELDSFQPCDWLFYEYNQSPTLKYTAEYRANPTTLGDYLQLHYVRTIAIVSWRKIESFMLWISHLTVPLI